MHQYENIPASLRQRRNWVAWGIRDAPLKSPFNPATLLSGNPLPAMAGQARTWGSYADAVGCVRRGLAQGIGYEFDGTGDLYGVDLDHVLEDGAITPQARAIVGNLASYTEVSPSGTGLHIFVTAPGADIARHRKKGGFVEIYSDLRYFTVTGNVYGDYSPIGNRTPQLQLVHDRLLLPDTERNIVALPAAPALSDSEQERFLHVGLARDKVLAALWGGERRNGNESADDQALMNKLTYWCNADPDAMIAAFLRSPHYLQKDESHQKKCRRADYLPRTAAAACATVYSTAKADHERWVMRRTQSRSIAR